MLSFLSVKQFGYLALFGLGIALYFYIANLREENKALNSQNQQLLTVNKSNETQLKNITLEHNQSLQTLKQYYEDAMQKKEKITQIKEVIKYVKVNKNEDDAPTAPILLDTIRRLHNKNNNKN